MRLSKNNLLIIWVVPVVLGIVIMYNFWVSVAKLYPLGMTTFLVFNQIVVIGAALFLGGGVYWSALVYYIYLIQENEVLIQDNFTKLAGSGTQHLENAEKLISQVLEDIRATELKPPQ